jgi:LuxR family maltose regulon positive regulatory protein
MDNPILATKLGLPLLRQDAIRRPRLVERLNSGLWQEQGFVRKLTLVSAPAGFGKTTLVSEWLHGLGPGAGNGSRFKAAWLSLDESDNDPARFLAYLVASLRQVQPGFGQATLSILQLPQPPPASALLTALVNELADLPTPFILALDDYHTIHSPPIHQQLTFILDNQPAALHLVLLTREDPLLPVARLRARGQLQEIRQEDLRFNNAETAEFLNSRLSQRLDPQDIAALENHTEGWIAGLQLAALSMQGRADPRAFIQSFTGSSRYILDYLIEEVFEHQPPEVKEFLLKTSILDQLCASLCEAILEKPCSQKTLAELEQANLFIVPLDASRTWYRYHHLFAELLRHRLRVDGYSQSDLHGRAARWYESQGLLQEAVGHRLAAQDWGNAARLIGAANTDMLKHGEIVTLLDWFGKLPREVVCANPGLCLAYAWAALLSSHFDLATSLLEQAEQLAEPASAFLGQVASAQAFLARSLWDNVRAIEKSEQALAFLPEADVTSRGNIAMTLGLAYWHEGRIAEATPVLAQASELNARSENFFALLTVQIFTARIAAVQGKLGQAITMLEKVIQAGGQVPILCLAHFDLVTLYQEWNDLIKAGDHMEKGLLLARSSGNLEFQQVGRLQQAVLAHARGDEAGALAGLVEADRLAENFPAEVRSRTAAFGVQLAVARNDPRLLEQWAGQAQAEVDAHPFYRFMGLARPRSLLFQGEKAGAARLLKQIHATATAAGWGYGALVVRILQSLAESSTEAAMPFLSEALRLGQPEGFIHSFVEAGEGLIPLLREAVNRGTEPAYAGHILETMRAGVRKERLDQPGLVEALSERELEVLRLVTAGLSNREIAARLVISPGTAKTHIHNLCGKLGARNRTEAAMRAKELGLV